MNETIFDYDTNKTEDKLTTSDVEDTETSDILENVAQDKSKAVEENVFNLVTCLMPDDPSDKIVFNKKTTAIKKKDIQYSPWRRKDSKKLDQREGL